MIDLRGKDAHFGQGDGAFTPLWGVGLSEGVRVGDTVLMPCEVVPHGIPYVLVSIQRDGARWRARGRYAPRVLSSIAGWMAAA